MSVIVGEVYCVQQMCTWEIWSNGSAYSSVVARMDGDLNVAYRREDGQWYTSLVSRAARVVPASPRLEEVFSAYIAGICTDPIDPHRHLRRR